MNQNKVYTYENMTDSMFISVPIPYKYCGIIELEDDVLLEYDTQHKPRAVEILNASKKFGVKKEQLENPKKIKMQFKVTPQKIEVNIQLTLQEYKPYTLTEQATNTDNIQIYEDILATPLI